MRRAYNETGRLPRVTCDIIYDIMSEAHVISYMMRT